MFAPRYGPDPQCLPLHLTEPPSLGNLTSLYSPRGPRDFSGSCLLIVFVIFQKYYNLVAYFAQFLHSIQISILRGKKLKKKRKENHFSGEETIAACRKLGGYSGAKAGNTLRKLTKTIPRTKK